MLEDYQKMIEFSYKYYGSLEIQIRFLIFMLINYAKILQLLILMNHVHCVQSFPKEGNSLDKKYKVTTNIARKFLEIPSALQVLF